ncbi:hypothetical protein BDP27DRAFT_1501743 [Rhodocollybia butyracea]|uniref:Uncharacterized protein n=1 Tax=Rhodocollybia butyracea TaxID=206335 RepID=A0A9P5PAJ5_9AGAR|nr:hypothetical protein BDP27DRAFT_1501743 [Rhodocollybia butyracea]
MGASSTVALPRLNNPWPSASKKRRSQDMQNMQARVFSALEEGRIENETKDIRMEKRRKATLPHVQYTLINEPSARVADTPNLRTLLLTSPLAAITLHQRPGQLRPGNVFLKIKMSRTQDLGVCKDGMCVLSPWSSPVGAIVVEERMKGLVGYRQASIFWYAVYLSTLNIIRLCKLSSSQDQDLSFTVQPSTPPASPNNDNQKLSVTLVDMLSPSDVILSLSLWVIPLLLRKRPWVFVGGCAAFVGERRCEREDGWDVDYGSSGNATVTEGGTDGNGNGLLEVTKRRRNPYGVTTEAIVATLPFFLRLLLHPRFRHVLEHLTYFRHTHLLTPTLRLAFRRYFSYVDDVICPRGARSLDRAVGGTRCTIGGTAVMS